jgi:hypothetical protein
VISWFTILLSIYSACTATVRTLTQQIKLKNLVLDSYIPPDELEKLTQHATYDQREVGYPVQVESS